MLGRASHLWGCSAGIVSLRPTKKGKIGQTHLDELQIAKARRRLLHHSQVLLIEINHLRAIGHVENTANLEQLILRSQWLWKVRWTSLFNSPIPFKPDIPGLQSEFL
jgi:hypothetical protein